VIRYLTDIDKAIPDDGTNIKLRLEWGWGFNDTVTKWNGTVNIKDGEIISAEPCFRGRPVLAPHQDYQPDGPVPHMIETTDKTSCTWNSGTIRNPTNLHPATQSLILKLDTGKKSSINIDINGIREKIPLASLMKGSLSFYTGKNISNAVRIHRAVPENKYRFDYKILDDRPEQDIDYYYLRIAQKNNQWAWVTPVWIES
jgi:hypothetical protein